ncbi:MAG: tannase/feruloyl esterase family alpha/beta hydrolase, partial [Ideonella sp.]|nr:tannase/feruloyl esterase family alpha/beta hydrolase [Ideonella sp.]
MRFEEPGFAVVSFDGDHQGSSVTFGLDPKAKRDFAYNAMDIVTVAAKALVTAYYTKAPVFSYAAGCSNGRRQVMNLSQRFPTYYDGILAGAATHRLSAGFVESAWGIQAVHETAPTNANGDRIHAQAFSDADLALVSKDLLDVLDGRDGLVDGVVSNTNASRFENYDPGRLQCSGDKTATCLTAVQVAGLRKLHSGARNSAGQRLYGSWPWDPGISGTQWRQWKLGTSPTGTPNSIRAAFADAQIGYLYLEPAEPNFRALTLDVDRDPPRMAKTGPEMDANNPDLTAFVRHGGKIMWYHGMADVSSPPSEI